MVRVFSFERATKNTYVYKEEKDAGGEVCGTIYIKKEHLPTKPPRILVNISEVPLEG